MTTLVLSPRKTEDGRRLASAATRLGWKVIEMEKWRVDNPEEFNGDICVHGEPLFCRLFAAQIGKVMIEPPHDWLVHLPNDVTRRKIKFIAFKDISGLELPTFIKPPDDKIFPAGVFTELGELESRNDIDPDQMILVSDVVSFRNEFRIHLLDGKAVSGSRYSVGGELSIDGSDPLIDQAKLFAERVFHLVEDITPPAVVIDVGKLDDEQWAVIEANPCFGAGIYGGDEANILQVLKKACITLGECHELEKFQFPLEYE